MRARYSRGAEGHIEEFGGSLRMFQPFGQDAKGKGLDAGDGFSATRSIAQHASSIGKLTLMGVLQHGWNCAAEQAAAPHGGAGRVKGSRLCAIGRRG